MEQRKACQESVGLASQGRKFAHVGSERRGLVAAAVRARDPMMCSRRTRRAKEASPAEINGGAYKAGWRGWRCARGVLKRQRPSEEAGNEGESSKSGIVGRPQGQVVVSCMWICTLVNQPQHFGFGEGLRRLWGSAPFNRQIRPQRRAKNPQSLAGEGSPGASSMCAVSENALRLFSWLPGRSQSAGGCRVITTHQA